MKHFKAFPGEERKCLVFRRSGAEIFSGLFWFLGFCFSDSELHNLCRRRAASVLWSRFRLWFLNVRKRLWTLKRLRFNGIIIPSPNWLLCFFPPAPLSTHTNDCMLTAVEPRWLLSADPALGPSPLLIHHNSAVFFFWVFFSFFKKTFITFYLFRETFSEVYTWDK